MTEQPILCRGSASYHKGGHLLTLSGVYYSPVGETMMNEGKRMNVLLSCPSESPEVRDDRLTELKEKYSNVRFYSPGESYHNEKSNRMASLDDRKNAAKMCDALLIDWTEGEESPTVHWEHCIAWNCGNPVGVLIPEGTDPRDYLPASMYYHSDVMDPNDNVIVHKLYELVNE